MARILIIVENLPVPFDRRVWMEATTLRDAGHDVTVICPTGKGHDAPEEEVEGIRVLRHPLPAEDGSAASYLVEYAAALYHEFRLSWRARHAGGFDVVHVCNPPDLLFLVALVHKVLDGARIVFDHHDLNPELYEVKYGRRDPFYYLLRLAERATFAVADLVLSTNESYRRIALERGGKRPENVHVVRSAPDLAIFDRADPEASDDPRLTVGYVGIMGDQDGVDLLLHAARRVVDRRGNTVAFRLVGGGPSSEELHRLRDELGLERHVEFTGFLGGRELLRTLSSFDVGVCPDPKNPYNDRCTMNKILEYMALGIPLVQFDLAEGRYSAGPASLYAEPNDPDALAERILELVDDAEARARLGAEGRARMEARFAWHHQAPRLLEAYERVLPKP